MFAKCELEWIELWHAQMSSMVCQQSPDPENWVYLFFYLEPEQEDEGAKRCSSRVLLNNCFYVDKGDK